MTPSVSVDSTHLLLDTPQRTLCLMLVRYIIKASHTLLAFSSAVNIIIYSYKVIWLQLLKKAKTLMYFLRISSFALLF